MLHVDISINESHANKGILHAGMNKEQEHCNVDWITDMNQI